MLGTLRGVLRIDMLPVLRRLPAYSRLSVALLREPALRILHKTVLVAGLAYLLSPIDVIPGLIPILGQLDDLAIALWTLRLALRTMPPDVADRHLRAHGLAWEVLDGDLARVGRTGRVLVRAGVRVGQRVAGRVGRTLVRLGIGILERRGLGRSSGRGLAA